MANCSSIRLKLVLVVVLFMLSSTVTLSAVERRSPLRAMVYATVFPGAGQAYNHKYLKAGIVLGTQAYLVSSAIRHENRYDDLKRKAADLSGSAQIDMLARADDYRAKARNDYWWIGTTLFLSIADAYVDAHLSDFESRKQKVHLQFEADTIGIGIEF